MNSNNDRCVLAIGIDAAEPSLVRELVEQGAMPVLTSLLNEGKWLQVESPSYIGSGAVWPTFITGQEPTQHGVYGEWPWQPEKMGLNRYSGRNLRPFWRPLIKQGMRVGILDIPFAPFTSFSDGFEICEWGPHDLLEGRLQISPSHLSDVITKQTAPHPLHVDRLDAAGPRDYSALKALTSGCLQGIQLRGALAQRLIKETHPDLAIIVFTELHHAGHYLWHTVAPEDPIYQHSYFQQLNSIGPTLKDLYRETDRQLGVVIDAAGRNSTVMVFSLHGMRPSHGVPALVEPLLCALGYARRANWQSQSWVERGVELMAEAKRHTPKSLKRAYYNTFPPATTVRLARPTMMPSYDWEQTRAFALPTDQHGWVRINLGGRETRGIVPPADYEKTCQELEEVIRALTTANGRQVVRDVFRTARNVQEAMVQRLPDLVVHWQDAAFSAPLTINGGTVQTELVGQKFTGQHALEGFCVMRGYDDVCPGDTLWASEMNSVIEKALGAEADE